VCRIIDSDRQLARSGGEIMARAPSCETLDAIVVAAAAIVGGVGPIRSQTTRRRCWSPDRAAPPA
jgi:hypothetical protein